MRGRMLKRLIIFTSISGRAEQGIESQETTGLRLCSFLDSSMWRGSASRDCVSGGFVATLFDRVQMLCSYLSRQTVPYCAVPGADLLRLDPNCQQRGILHMVTIRSAAGVLRRGCAAFHRLQGSLRHLSRSNNTTFVNSSL